MNVGYFNPEIAKKVGVVEAVFLQKLYHSIQENRKLCVLEEGKLWFPCAMKDWGDYIDLWPPRQVDRIAKSCLRQRVLFLAYYDTDERRRRSWYAIDNAITSQLEEIEQIMKYL